MPRGGGPSRKLHGKGLRGVSVTDSAKIMVEADPDLGRRRPFTAGEGRHRPCCKLHSEQKASSVPTTVDKFFF